MLAILSDDFSDPGEVLAGSPSGLLSRYPPKIGKRLFSKGSSGCLVNEKLQRLHGASLPGDLIFLFNRDFGIPGGRSRGLRNRLRRFARGSDFGHQDTPFAKKIVWIDQ